MCVLQALLLILSSHSMTQKQSCTEVARRLHPANDVYSRLRRMSRGWRKVLQRLRLNTSDIQSVASTLHRVFQSYSLINALHAVGTLTRLIRLPWSQVLIDCSGPPDEPKNEQTGLARKREALLRQLDRRKALRTLIFCNTIQGCRQVGAVHSHTRQTRVLVGVNTCANWSKALLVNAECGAKPT